MTAICFVFCGELTQIMYDGLEDCSTWVKITRHARNCIVPIDKVYVYGATHATIYINSIFDLVKVQLVPGPTAISQGGVEWPQRQLDEAQKVSLTSNYHE